MLACSGEPEPPPQLPVGTGAEACAAQPFEQLRVDCYVEAAARAGREGSGPRAEEACAAVPDGQWRDECHFRAGEELAKAGALVTGLGFCGNAGRFATFCTTHAIWGAPASGEPLAAWLPGVDALPANLRAEGADTLRARWWFNRYYGVGAADPAAAKAAPEEEAAHARGAWALEAVRLTEGDLAAARAAWAAGTPLTGAPTDERIGRYDAPFQIPGEQALPRVRTFGGGARLVGEAPDEDLEIALLEALYFRQETTADAFRAALSDPRPRVRYTALRCFRTLPSPDAEAVLTPLRTDPDPIVVAHVEDALKYKTWLGKPNKAGPRQGP